MKELNIFVKGALPPDSNPLIRFNLKMTSQGALYDQGQLSLPSLRGR